MLGDERAHGFDDGGGVAEAVEDFGGHARAEFGVAVEADAVRRFDCRGLADVVEEDAEGEFDRRLVEPLEHEQGVGPDVAFGMELGRLGDALHGFDFGEDGFEEVQFVEEFEASAGVGFGEDASQFVAGSFGGDGGDFETVGADGFGGFRFDIEGETGGEADGAEEAEMVLGEALGGAADGADEFVGQVGLAIDIVEDAVGLDVEEHAVDGEVTAGGVLDGVGFELDGLGAPAVGVGAVAAEGGDFDAVPEDDAEVGADEFGSFEELREFIGAGIGGDVPVLWFAAEEHIADAAADEVGAVAGGVKAVENLSGCGGDVHPTSYRASNPAL